MDWTPRLCWRRIIKTIKKYWLEKQSGIEQNLTVLNKGNSLGGALLLKTYGDLTEVRRTRPERTMSGVVGGLAESSVPG